MIVIGVDPGSIKTGFAIGRFSGNDNPELIELGVLEAPAKWPLAKRLSHLHSQLTAVFEKHPAQIAVVEKMFLGKSAESAFRLGHMRGVCLAVASAFNCELEELAARQVKKLVTGYGAAEKEQVQTLLGQYYSLPKGLALDATDALALVVAFSRIYDSNQKLKRIHENEVKL